MHISSQVGVRVHSLLLMRTTLTISLSNRTRQASEYAQTAGSLYYPVSIGRLLNMTFGEVYNAIVVGKKVSRVHWDSDKAFLRWSEAFNAFVFMIDDQESVLDGITLPTEDFFADDWIVIEEPAW